MSTMHLYRDFQLIVYYYCLDDYEPVRVLSDFQKILEINEIPYKLAYTELLYDKHGDVWRRAMFLFEKIGDAEIYFSKLSILYDDYHEQLKRFVMIELFPDNLQMNHKLEQQAIEELRELLKRRPVRYEYVVEEMPENEAYHHHICHTFEFMFENTAIEYFEEYNKIRVRLGLEPVQRRM